MTGKFIVFEGPDGSGTSYHSRMLAQTLRNEGKNVLLTAEPTSGPIGTLIRTTLKEGDGFPAESLQLLFCADRAWHQREIRSALERGEPGRQPLRRRVRRWRPVIVLRVPCVVHRYAEESR